MTAAEAYRKAMTAVEQNAGWLRAQTPKQLQKLALELETIADYFEQHPERWCAGRLQDDTKVCSIGLFNTEARKDAGIKDFTKPKNLNRLIGDHFIISLNDSWKRVITGQDGHGWNTYTAHQMGPRNIVRVYRQVAAGLREMADTPGYRHMLIQHVENVFFRKRLENAARKAEWGKLYRNPQQKLLTKGGKLTKQGSSAFAAQAKWASKV
jgi:hypothetical protein